MVYKYARDCTLDYDEANIRQEAIIAIGKCLEQKLKTKRVLQLLMKADHSTV